MKCLRGVFYNSLFSDSGVESGWRVRNGEKGLLDKFLSLVGDFLSRMPM